jgi:FKBP-type peptidyl-prolyl cis-trans isomerase
MAIGFAGLACTEAKPQATAAPTPDPLPRTADPASLGLKITDQKVGTGAEAAPGKVVAVNYTGWLESNHKQFDSSIGRRPFEFRLAAGEVIKGWDLGVAGMKVGGKRNLVIPGSLAYGPGGAGGGLIPPDATLVFDVELLEVK